MTDPRPMVSVVVPNYNGARTLELCLRSVQAQTYRPVELLLVDDGSTDDSVAVARRLGVEAVRAERNQGVGFARNLGVERAKGEFLVFLDSDVTVVPDAVEVAVAMLEADPQTAVVCSIHDPEPLIRDSRFEEYRALQYYYWAAASEGPISFLFPAMCVMRRTVFEDVGPFKPWLRQTEEVDYGNRLTQRYTMVLTRAVRSRQDYDARLLPLMRKLFVRGCNRVPLYARRRRFARGFETPHRAGGTLAALAAVLTLPLLLLGPVTAVVPVSALLVSIVSDLGMYRFILDRRGPGFVLYSGVMQFAVNVTIASGVIFGALRWMCSGSFRRLYDGEGHTPTAVTREATA